MVKLKSIWELLQTGKIISTQRLCFLNFRNLYAYNLQNGWFKFIYLHPNYLVKNFAYDGSLNIVATYSSYTQFILKYYYPQILHWSVFTLMYVFFCREVATPSGSLDNMSLKIKLHASVAMLAKKNPVLKDELKFPSMEKSRLLTLVKQT